MNDLANIVLNQLRVKDGSRGPYAIVGYETDTNHPWGFNGHNHSNCKVVTLLVQKCMVDGQILYVFDQVNINTEDHRMRRENRETLVWEKDSICYRDREGAAAFLYTTAKYMRSVDLLPVKAVEEIMDSKRRLTNTKPATISIGDFPITTLQEASYAISTLDAVVLSTT